MRFSELAGEPQPIRAQKADLLIVIPCYGEYEMLVRHLDLLARQTFQTFNVLAVLGPRFEQEKLAQYASSRRFSFGLLLCKRTSERGGAGAFYAGQRYALENGYAYCILADADCLPTDEKVVEGLYGAAKGGANYVSPAENLISEGGSRFPLTPANRAAFTSIYHYTLFSSALMRKFGLIFLPAYGGAEDVEYAERLGSEPRSFISASVSHPFIMGDATYRKFDKFWVYTLNTLFLVKNPKRVALNLARVLLSALAISLFFTSPLRSLGNKIISHLFAYRYGKESFDNFSEVDYRSQLVQLDGPTKARLRSLSFDEYLPNPFRLLPRLLSSFPSTFGQDVVVERSRNDLQVTLLALSARKLYYNMGKENYLLLADNTSILLHTLKLLLLIPLLIIGVPLGFILFLPLKYLFKQPKTTGYGLDGL